MNDTRFLLVLAFALQLFLTTRAAVLPRSVTEPENQMDLSIVSDLTTLAKGSQLQFKMKGQKNKIEKFTLERYQGKNGDNVTSEVVATIDNPGQENCRDVECDIQYEFSIPNDILNYQPYFIKATIEGAEYKSSSAFMIYNANNEAFLTENINSEFFIPTPDMFEFPSNQANEYCYGKEFTFKLKGDDDLLDVFFYRYDGAVDGSGNGFTSIDYSKFISIAPGNDGKNIEGRVYIPKNYQDNQQDLPYFIKSKKSDNQIYTSNFFFIKNC